MKHVPKHIPSCHRVGGIVLHAWFGFKGLVLNVDRSVLVTGSVEVWRITQGQTHSEKLITHIQQV